MVKFFEVCLYLIIWFYLPLSKRKIGGEEEESGAQVYELMEGEIVGLEALGLVCCGEAVLAMGIHMVTRVGRFENFAHGYHVRNHTLV